MVLPRIPRPACVDCSCPCLAGGAALGCRGGSVRPRAVAAVSGRVGECQRPQNWANGAAPCRALLLRGICSDDKAAARQRGRSRDQGPGRAGAPGGAGRAGRQGAGTQLRELQGTLTANASLAVHGGRTAASSRLAARAHAAGSGAHAAGVSARESEGAAVQGRRRRGLPPPGTAPAPRRQLPPHLPFPFPTTAPAPSPATTPSPAPRQAPFPGCVWARSDVPPPAPEPETLRLLQTFRALPAEDVAAGLTKLMCCSLLGDADGLERILQRVSSEASRRSYSVRSCSQARGACAALCPAQPALSALSVRSVRPAAAAPAAPEARLRPLRRRGRTERTHGTASGCRRRQPALPASAGHRRR